MYCLCVNVYCHRVTTQLQLINISISIYLLTAFGLSFGGSSTVHIYAQTIHRTTQRTTQITTNLEECGPCPVFASFTLAFALQLRKKHGKTSVRVRKTSVRVRKPSVRLIKTSKYKNLSQGKKNLCQGEKNLSQSKKNLSQGKENLSHSTIYILPKHPHITKPKYTHTL